MSPWNKHPEEVREEAIRLLLDGKTADEVSEVISVNKNTIISWRQSHSKENGVDFPKHYKGGTGGSRKGEFGKGRLLGFRYTDDEIIILARQNPGFGIHRFCKELYPKGKKNTVRFRVTMLLNEYREETGEDLYDLLQDPDYSTLVSENEYKMITGKKYVPKGLARAVGGRSSKVSKGYGKGVRKVKEWKNIPLPPQEFNWGNISSSEVRTELAFENIENSE